MTLKSIKLLEKIWENVPVVQLFKSFQNMATTMAVIEVAAAVAAVVVVVVVLIAVVVVVAVVDAEVVHVDLSVVDVGVD